MRFTRKLFFLGENSTPRLLFALGEIVLVVVGILVALQINNWNEVQKNLAKERVALEAVISDIEQVESFLDGRLQIFQSDSIWLDYISRHWDNLDVDSVARAFSTNGFGASFHNLFLDFREFHPPLASLTAITQDGTFNLIENKKIKRKINSLIYHSLKAVQLNVQVEIDLQLKFKEMLISDDDPDVVRLLDSTQDELFQRFKFSDAYHEKSVFELEVITSKAYARNYLNMKARHRLLIEFFIGIFKTDLLELKVLIIEELQEDE